MKIEVIKNNHVPGEFDYSEWEKIAELALLSNYVLLDNRHKKKYPDDTVTNGRAYSRSLLERSYAGTLQFRFTHGSKAERLAMKSEIDKVEEKLYKHHRSFITCTCGARCSAGN